MRRVFAARALSSGVAAIPATRAYSEARTSMEGHKAPVWPKPGERPTYPAAQSAFPLKKPAFRKTHIEWKLHHGHGSKYGQYGPSRELADFEYADGTPASINGRRFAFKHHQDHLLVQLIRAGALVEKYEQQNILPRIPGTPEQRDWDPAIPLFLDDVDEHGQPPRPVAGEALDRVIDAHFASVEQQRPSSAVVQQHAGETLEPNTMFASYDPAAFVSDEVKQDVRRPFWSRRRWALTDSFLVPMSPKPKNTIKDE